MTSMNAFTDPPRLPLPAHYRFSHRRTTSRSPARQYARDLDPMLRDLSPSATLRAFVTDPNELSASDALTASIRSSSIGDRALGAKAAQACLDLRSWTRELEAWAWPGTFDVPEPMRKKARLSSMTFSSVFSGAAIEAADEGEEVGVSEHWGSLPAQTVRTHEQRLDEICQKLDEMDVEELKEYVLATHYRAVSRPPSRDDSIGAIHTSTDMKHLDDFTAVVTAIILQALPYLSKLNRLLETWTVRLRILRNTPSYLEDLKRARRDLDHGWAAIAVSAASGSLSAHAAFDLKTMLDMKIMIESQVGGLGRRLDRFLDDLEGRNDTVPDAWIDDFEILESAYSSWVVQAGRKVLENEWYQGAERSQADAASAAGRAMYETGHSGVAADLEIPDLDHDAVMRPSMERTDDHDVQSGSAPRTIGVTNVSPSVSRDPALKSSIGLYSRPIPNLITEEAAPFKELHDSGIGSFKPSREGTPSPSVPENQSQVAKKRAAFLGEIERTNSLKQSKSPPVVRPFEHASNAFTRLFKKDRSPEQIKSKRSASSRFSSDEAPTPDGESKRNYPLSSSSKLVASTNGKASHTPGTVIDVGNENNVRSFTAPVKAKSDDIHTAESAKAESPLSARRAHEVRNLDIVSHKRSVSQNPGLSSPFHSPDMLTPTDWPLPSPVKGTHTETQSHDIPQPASPASLNRSRVSHDELHTPAAPIQSDVFDQIFVDSIPSAPAFASPDRRPRSARASSSSTWGVGPKRASSLPRSDQRALADLTRPDIPSDYLDMISFFKQDTSPTPSRSNGISKDVPGTTFQAPTLDIAYATQLPLESNATSPAPDTRASATRATEDDDEAPGLDRPSAMKRASVTSIEMFSRAQLKSIDVPKSRQNSISSRQNSVSSRMTPPHTPRHALSSENVPRDVNEDQDSSSMMYKGLEAFPTPPKTSALSTSASDGQTPPFLRTAGSSLGAGASPSEAPLNVAMKKRRVQSGLRNENQTPRSADAPISPSKKSAADPAGDNFDRHVSEVLDTLPTDIRFKVRPGAETPAPRAGHAALRPKAPHSRRTSRDHSMTIAPAEISPKKSSLMSDPEVKLYHLTQAGREDPIKLFVRLVGEGERVMVRVGGGWADLADYLRQYADHHGSRTVSEGGIEVQTMPNVLSRKVSGPAEIRAKTPVTPRPDSSDSDKDWSMRSNTTSRPENGRITPAFERERQTPTATTPGSSSNGSRPSTATASRPPSRQNVGDVSLGGPSSGKKNALSEHKAKWVEGMIERAKQASAEKSREDNPKYFGEIGKAGGTRRVIFRSGSGVGPADKTK